MNDHLANNTAAPAWIADSVSPGLFLVGIDGRSGSGKTTLAGDLAAELRGRGRRVEIVEVEDFIGGWAALTADIGSVATLAHALRAGSAVGRTWDWATGTWGAKVRVPPQGRADIVIIAGCGSTSKGVRAHLDLTVWLEAPTEIRRSRVRERDSYDWSTYWDMWARQEDELLAGFPSDVRNDVILETASPVRQ